MYNYNCVLPQCISKLNPLWSELKTFCVPYWEINPLTSFLKFPHCCCESFILSTAEWVTNLVIFRETMLCLLLNCCTHQRDALNYGIFNLFFYFFFFFCRAHLYKSISWTAIIKAIASWNLSKVYFETWYNFSCLSPASTWSFHPYNCWIEVTFLKFFLHFLVIKALFFHSAKMRSSVSWNRNSLVYLYTNKQELLHNLEMCHFHQYPHSMIYCCNIAAIL